MFCNYCGAEVQAGYNYCPKCSRALAPPTAQLAASRLQRHLRTLGILWVVVGVLSLIPSFVMMTLGSMVHFIVPGPEIFVRNLGPFFMFMLGGAFLIMGVGGIILGWGLMHHEPWARMLAIVLGVIALFRPPLGTALGIYTLWVLLADEGGLEYQRLARTV
jgi:hypothetical protein